MSWELLNMVSGGNRLAAEVVLRATPRGQTTAVEVNCCLYYLFRDGEILSEHLYVDSAALPAL